MNSMVVFPSVFCIVYQAGCYGRIMELIPEIRCQKPTRDWLQHLSSNLWASTMGVYY